MKIQNELLTLTIVGATYSFGTFGGLALLHINPIIQFLVLFCSVYIIFRLCQKPIRKITIYGMSIFILSIFLQAVYGAELSTLRDSMIALFLVAIILNSSPDQIKDNSKLILNICTVLNAFVLIAFILYFTDKELLASANHEIYTSNRHLYSGIHPQIFTEWLSFTSGDGYTIGELNVTRLQGYAPEPSATVVHYFAPAIFGFLLGGRYVVQSVFIILVNIIAISSALTVFIILCAVMFWTYILISKVILRKLWIPISGLCFLIIISTIDVSSLVLFIGSKVFLILDVDLIARKVNDTGDGGSIATRLEAITQSLQLISTSPFGYLNEKNTGGGGLFYTVCAYLGWAGGLLFIGSIIRIGINIAEMIYCATFTGIGLSLLISTFIFASFFSGYCWDRPAGIVIIVILLSLVAGVKVKCPSRHYGNKVSNR